MKLSFIFELLLIFILIAFAASAVIDSKAIRNSRQSVGKGRKHHHHGKVAHKKRESSSGNKYCSCSTKLCNCCREFNIPVVSLQGPGCASLQYLKGDRLAISMSFGERVLTNTTISSKKPQPVCMPLPGGVSKFCGRVYNIERKGQDFNACLGLELRSLKDVEAALRVSCFRFGANGLRVEPSQPLPPIEKEPAGEDEDDDEDDDDDDDDDDDEDDDDFGFDDEDDDEDEDDENDVDSVDYGTFSVFDDDFIGEYFQTGSGSTKKKTKKPVVATTTTKPPVRRKVTRKPTIAPARTNKPPQKRKATIPPKSANSNIKIIKTTSTYAKPSTTTPAVELANEVASKPSDIQISSERTPWPPHESIVMSPSLTEETTTSQATDNEVRPTDVAPVFSPIRITSATDTQTSTQLTTSDMPANIITEQPVSLMPQAEVTEPAIESEQKHETTTLIENSDPTTELTTTNTPIDNEGDSDEDDSDEDPISEVVEEVLNDEDESTESNEATTQINDKDIGNATTKVEKNKEAKDVLEDIMDGVVDTFIEEEKDTPSKKNGVKKGQEEEEEDDDDDDDDEDIEDDDDEDDDDEEEDDDDEDHDDDDDEEEARRFIQLKKRRKSRDMWLARLHW